MLVFFDAATVRLFVEDGSRHETEKRGGAQDKSKGSGTPVEIIISGFIWNILYYTILD